MSATPPGSTRTLTRTSEPDRGRWRVERWRGPAQGLHDLVWPEPLVPTVWILEPDRPALVLGSTQSVDEVDAGVLAADGVELARRRSGGGAVLLDPGETVWIDVLVPRGDPRWDDDVSRSSRWLGEAWVGALADLRPPSAGQVHEGPIEHGRWGRRVCFAGLGPGEVTVGGAKAVGLSQRRTRAGARFQGVAYRSWRAEPLGALAGLDPRSLPAAAVLRAPRAEIEQALLGRLDASIW